MYKAKVDQKLFDAVKIMLESGATGPEIEKFLKISQWTISKIRSAENYEEYKAILAARALATKEKAKKAPTEDQNAPADVSPQVVEHRQSVTVQTTYYVSQKLDKLCDLLTAISAKLAFVVDELTK